MSIIRPKDDDYVVRGIELLIVWFIVAPIPFIGLGALAGSFVYELAGTMWALITSGTVFLSYIAVGLFGYSKYLDWGLKYILGKTT